MAVKNYNYHQVLFKVSAIIRTCFKHRVFTNSRWIPEMSEKKVVKVLLSQLEEALEERQSNDRRKQTPEDIENDRRKNDRRDSPVNG